MLRFVLVFFVFLVVGLIVVVTQREYSFELDCEKLKVRKKAR